MGSITIKILLQSANVGQIAKKTIQFHIPKDLLKFLMIHLQIHSIKHNQKLVQNMEN